MPSRLPELVYEDLTVEQQKAYDMIAGPRDGSVNGPFPAWIRMPVLCERIQGVSDVLRTNTTLKKQMFEIITLVVARSFNAAYMWGAHAGFAIKAGIAPEIVDDINNGCRPIFEDPKDQAIFDVSDVLAKGQLLDQEKYDEALALLGTETLIEVATDVGFYLMIASVLNTFDVKPSSDLIPLAPR